MERLYRGQLQNFLNGYQAGSGAELIYQLAPDCGSLYGHLSHPLSITHFPELSIIFSSALPPIVLFNAGSFPAAIQRVLPEKFTRQVRGRIYKQETHLYDLEKIHPTPGQNCQPPAHEQHGSAKYLLCWLFYWLWELF